MAIHDWSGGDHGLFHHFHQAWTIEIVNSLNGGALPPGFFAMAEQIVSGPIPDVVTLKRRPTSERPDPAGGVAVADAPPQARFVTSAEVDLYATKANRIVIKHRLGQIVAVIEIPFPGQQEQPARSAILRPEGGRAAAWRDQPPRGGPVPSFRARSTGYS